MAQTLSTPQNRPSKAKTSNGPSEPISIRIEAGLRKYVTPLVLLSIAIILHLPIEIFLDALLINPILSKIESNLFTDIFVIVSLAFYVGWWFYFNKQSRKLVTNHSIYLLGLLAIYILIYRAEMISHWSFVAFKNQSSIKYVDVFFLIPVTLMLYKLSSKKPHEIKRLASYQLFDDSFISNSADDRLFRAELSEEIAKYIYNSRSNLSIAVGINAPWGHGKSSVQILIRRHIESLDSSAIIFEFNPWRSQNEAQILPDFFESFSSHLGRINFELSNLVTRYSNKIIDKSDSWVLRIIDQLFLQSFDREEIFQKINMLLERVDRKIIVFIDDIDRLNQEEILSVLKLVRNSANFKNTYFVIGFDRDYVTQYIDETYLEKIFQVQFELSAISEKAIKDELYVHLIKVLPDQEAELKRIIHYMPNINEAFDSAFLGARNQSDLIPMILFSLRDVKRFVNSFILKLNIVKTEVVLSEYFFISLLTFKYPNLVKAIREDHQHALVDRVNEKVSVSKEAIAKICTSQKISEKNIETINDIFDHLFPKETKQDRQSQKSIRYLDNFNIYFDNNLTSKLLLYKEVYPVLSQEWKPIKEQVGQWILEKKTSNLNKLLYDVEMFGTVERFEKITSIFIVLINYQHNAETNIEYWSTEVSKNTVIINRFYGQEKTFLKALFLGNSTGYFFTSNILSYLIAKMENDKNFAFPFTLKEIQDFSVTKLGEFIATRSGFDIRAFWHFYYHCIASLDGYGNLTMLDDANKMIHTYLQLYPEDYLKFSLQIHDPLSNQYIFDRLIPLYFGTWELYEEFLKKHAVGDLKLLVDLYELFVRSARRPVHYEKPIPWLEPGIAKLITSAKEQTYQNYVLECEGKLAEPYQWKQPKANFG